MDKTQEALFEERQYLGRNAYWLNRRLVLAAFCFVAYWVTGNPKNGELFLLVGTCILIISFLLFFILYFKTVVYKDFVLIDGMWGSRRVKIDLNNIVSVHRAPYSHFWLNNPVYNLHKKGSIRFFAGGKESVNLTDKDGLVYMIGSKQADQLSHLIQDLLPKAKSKA